MIFILFLDILQYLKRFFGGGRFYYHLLETAFQGAILLNVLSIFIQGGGADTLYLSTRQSRLQHIGSIHRTGCGSCTYNSVNFVDEKDDIRIFLQLVDYRTDTFLKLSAILRSGHNRGHIEHHNTLFKEDTRNFLLHNAQCQSFYDSRFSDTRFANQDRVVLFATAQYLRQTLYFTLTPYNRVQFTFFSSTRHIHTEVIQHGSIVRRLLGCRLCRRR